MTRHRYLDAWEILHRIQAPRLLAEIMAIEARRKRIQPTFTDPTPITGARILQESNA